MAIVDGLPIGTTIEIDATLTDYYNIVRTGGGTLGGEIQDFDATLDWVCTGTGDLTGFNRHLAIPVHCEVHTAPRTPGDPVQTFDQDMFRLQGQLFGDPDFCELIVTAGTDLGLPSPGQTTLTEVPSGDYAVDSFFDITYQIQFQGCPGSPLDDLLGTTTGTDRFRAGEPLLSAILTPPSSPQFVLHQNNPNPFNPATTIQYDVPARGGRVRLDIIDLRGRIVSTLINEFQPAGRKEVIWDGKYESGPRAPSGVYLYVLRTSQGILARKMAIIK